MALHRRTKVTPTFNMSSMTDIIFLLLIFFMITSTLVSPNAIKVNLPQSKKQTTTQAAARVILSVNDSSQVEIYAAPDGGEEVRVDSIQELPMIFAQAKGDSIEADSTAEFYVSLYADEMVPYKNVVEILNVANENHFKMILATRQPEK